jgi:hypothetical protein
MADRPTKSKSQGSKPRRGSRRFQVNAEIEQQMERIAIARAREDQDRRDRLIATRTQDLVMSIASAFAVDEPDISTASIAVGIRQAFEEMIAAGLLDGEPPSVETIAKTLRPRSSEAEFSIEF